MKSLYGKTRNSFIETSKNLSANSSFVQYISPYIDSHRKNLTTEYLKIGKESSEKWLILSSGTIGPDFFIGSNIQTYITKLIALKMIKVPDDVGILIIHGINSWGAAWIRPGNINNVILDMNFYDNFSDLATLEEADEERKKMNQIYSLLFTLRFFLIDFPF